MKVNAIETYGPVIREIEAFVSQSDSSVRLEAFRFLLARECAGESGAAAVSSQNERPRVSNREISPSELLRMVGFETISDKALLLGYWLELHKGVSSFSSGKLKEAFDQAREAPPANPSDVVAKLEAAGKLLRAERVGAT